LKSDVETKLVSSCRRGDTSAYAGLVSAYSGRIFAISLGMLGNKDDAEDVAQQVLLKGFADIGQLRDGERFGAWICQIAKNLCIDFIRRRRRERRVVGRQGLTGQNDSEDYLNLENALSKLSEDSRVVLLLYYFDGRDSKKIAETLSISKAAVHKRLSRARKELHKLLAFEVD